MSHPGRNEVQPIWVLNEWTGHRKMDNDTVKEGCRSTILDCVTTWTSGCWMLQVGHGVMGGGSHLYAQVLVGWTWIQLHGGGELRLPRCTMSVISETDNGAHLR